jgi:hypothetical protein
MPMPGMSPKESWMLLFGGDLHPDDRKGKRCCRDKESDKGKIEIGGRTSRFTKHFLGDDGEQRGEGKVTRERELLSPSRFTLGSRVIASCIDNHDSPSLRVSAHVQARLSHTTYMDGQASPLQACVSHLQGSRQILT